MTRPIGGFLPLRLPGGTRPAQPVLAQWIGEAAQVWLLHNARSALHYLWTATKPRRLWLPAYVCSEVAMAAPLGVDARYYPLDEMLFPRVEYLSARIDDGDHVLAVDYFGRPASTDFVLLVQARPEVGWVEDRAHALDPTDAPWGDWLLYSPRKLFGVPDGGILVARRKSLPDLATKAATEFSFLLPSLERFEDVDESDNQRWYASYIREEGAMSVGMQRMSQITLQLLRASDARADGDARRSNYSYLHRRLREWAFFQDPAIEFAPLGFPVRVSSAAALARGLSERGIFAARHWSTLPSDPSTFAIEHRLAGELLTLPCDYRYREVEMRRVADAVIDLIARGV